MIVYLDTSAVIPILIEESSSETCWHLWADADVRASSGLTYVEVAAALAMAERQGRITSAEFDEAWNNFTDMWLEVVIIHLGDDLARKAAALSRSESLRGYDAVHCASALEIDEAELVAASGDVALLAAWHAQGVAVLDINGH